MVCFMKKVMSLLLSLCVLLSICGCNASDSNSTYRSEIDSVTETNDEVSSNDEESASNTSQIISNPTDAALNATSSRVNNVSSKVNNMSSNISNTSSKTNIVSSNINNSSSKVNIVSSNTGNSSVIVESKNIICVSPENKSTVSLLNDDMNSYSSQKYTPSKMDEYFTGKDNFAPKSIELTWGVIGKQPTSYQIEVSLNKNMSESVKYTSNKPELTLYNLFAAKTYYWRVTANLKTQTIMSAVFSFSTQNYPPRTIYAEGVSNTRDIGGWKTASGKRVKQGMIYRGAKLNDITSNGIKTMVNTLGIKLDLDLRNSSETGGKKVSPLGSNVSYCNVSFPYYALGTSTSIDSANNHEAIVGVMGVLANPENYPIYIHCSIGRDRTGTLVSLINGLLGVSEEDLARDYELSYFAGCFGDNPIPMSDMLPKFLTIPEYIKTYNGRNYSQSVENFLLEIGVSQEDIDSIRSIMLE